MVVDDQDGRISFLKKVRAGPSSNSYGIHVARLAGLPESVILRAADILQQLPNQVAIPVAAPVRSQAKQASLFSPLDQIEAELRNFNIEQSTPLQGLALLERWKKLFN